MKLCDLDLPDGLEYRFGATDSPVSETALLIRCEPRLYEGWGEVVVPIAYQFKVDADGGKHLQPSGLAPDLFSVPEPSGLPLALFALVALARKRKGRPSEESRPPRQQQGRPVSVQSLAEG